MTERRTAQGRSSSAAKYRSGGSAGQRKISSRERVRLAQFVICAIIFVSVVAVKLLLPGKLGAVRSSVANAMDRNMNVTEVFSAVSKAFSSKKNFKKSAHDVYQAVFHPEDGAVETAAKVPEGLTQSSQKASAKKTDAAASKKKTEKNSAAGSTAAGSTAAQAKKQSATTQKETAKLACVLYSAANCPKNVNMEQVVLGFHYCTPVQGTISSPFGYREHPIEGEERFHYGIDLAADTGTAIRCFADGTVTVAGESTSYGKYIMVEHRGGYATLYAHCSKLLVQSGKKVSAGQKIAEVGETGMATGPHLHFELHQGNIYLNPIYYVTAEKA